jgi:mono/diheme cytochrome c family protein
MNRPVKIFGIVVGILAGLAAAGITATIGWRPIVGPRLRPLADRRFESTPARLARGQYLMASGAVPCILCHSELDVTAAGELKLRDGFLLAGRNWTPDGVPWMTAPNLTPDPETGAGRWSDDQLARAIREGIGHDDRPLFPIMPYVKFKAMSDEDLAAVIVYLRSIPPVKHSMAKSAIPFPLSRLINSLPEPVPSPVSPDLSTPEKRGAYLTTLAACADCHSPTDDKGNAVPGMDFAGGSIIHFDGVKDRASANITPGVNGIPYYDEALFIETMRTGRVRERALSTMMPTAFYRNMTDEDLKAIFAYLRTLAPVDHYVDNSISETACPRCGLKHGGGERNKKTTGADS